MKSTALYEGSFSVDATKQFIPFNPSLHNVKDRPASLFIYVQPFLIETSDGLCLIDTGLGVREPNGELQLHNNIRNAGYNPDDVSMVLMSHLHYDHAGGLMYEDEGSWKLAFPHADYYVQRGELESALTKKSSSYRQPQLEALWRTPNLHFMEGSGRLNSEITYELTGGHCEFHQVFLFDIKGDKYFFGGDIVPEPEQLLRKFMAKYDKDPRKAMELRQEYGIRAAAEDWICMFYHAKSRAIGRVRYENEVFSIEDAI